MLLCHARKLLIAASLTSWLSSLGFVALATKDQAVFGLQLFFGGALGPLVGEFAWYANPAYFLALYWLAMYKPGHCRAAASVALVLSLLPVAVPRIWLHEGFSTPITSYGTGYHLWVGAILVLAATAWLFPRRWPSGTPHGPNSSFKSKPLRGST